MNNLMNDVQAVSPPPFSDGPGAATLTLRLLLHTPPGAPYFAFRAKEAFEGPSLD